MARGKSLNFVKLNDELFASDAAIDPVLTAAKITVLKVDGKDVPAAEAPLPIKIAAIGALVASGDKTSDSAELIAANGQLATQVDALNGELATAKATSSALQQKLNATEASLATERASTSKLTADGGTNANLLRASNEEVGRLTKELAAVNREISTMCVAGDVLALNDAGGKALAKDAPQDAKLAAADAVPVMDKLKAYRGAVNAAIAKTGASALDIPNLPPGGPGAQAKAPELKGFDRMKSAMKVQGRTAARN